MVQGLHPPSSSCWHILSSLLFTIAITSSTFPCPTTAAPFRQRFHSSQVLSVTPQGTHNLIPRFNIPRGNLTYQRTPYWEAIYFLKYGLAPPKHDSLNDTELSRVLEYQNLIENSTHNRRSFIGGAEGPNEGDAVGIVDLEGLRAALGAGVFKGEHYQWLPDLDYEGILNQNKAQGPIRFVPSYEEAMLNEELSQAIRDHENEITEDDIRTMNIIVPPRIKTALRSGGHVTLRNSPPSIRNFQRGLDKRGHNDDEESVSIDKRGLIYLTKMIKSTKPQARLEQVVENPEIFMALLPSNNFKIDDKTIQQLEPAQLLRAYVQEREDEPIASWQQGKDPVNYHDKTRKAGTASRSLFMRSLVPRSSSGPGNTGGGTGGSEAVGLGNGGVQGEVGRKFQTQGW